MLALPKGYSSQDQGVQPAIGIHQVLEEA